jgi:O-antigen ligase
MRIVLIFTLLVYCFVFGILDREIGGFQYGLMIEGLILTVVAAVLVKTSAKEYTEINKDLFYLLLVWFVISLLQVLNPGASLMGWVSEIRSTALYPLLMVMLGLLIFNQRRHLDLFLVLIIGLSTLASLNGIKQLYFGPSSGEQAFLNGGGAITHILFGRLRVFSFYSDAGQFGASQAQLGLIALILGFGPFRKWTKCIFLSCSGLMLYGMLISGTRGALFALVIGGFVALVLSKNLKVLLLGGLVGILFLSFLKFTYIGNSNYQIYRLRSAVNPNDPSLNVRFNTQKLLREYMSSRPFGGGLGVIGHNGILYNSDKFLSTVPPDSYFVKVWAMYGIVGFTIWLSIMLYVFGKCCGIVWRLEDKEIKIKMIALTSGFAGILFCSYGNEVINSMPSSIVVYFSWVFIYKSPQLQGTGQSFII